MSRSVFRIASLAAALFLAVTSGEARADSQPPRIEHTPIAEAPRGKPLTITAKITDPDGIFEPVVYFRASGATKFQTASFEDQGGTMSATVPTEITASDFEYFLEAYDADGNGPSRSGSDTAPHKVKVVDPAPPQVAVAPEPEKKVEPAPEVKVARPSDEDLRDDALRPDASVKKSEGGGVSGRFIGGLVGLGLGAASAGAGVYFGITANDLRASAASEPSASVAASKFEDAKSNALRANIGYIAGGVLAAGGLLLMLWPEEEEDPLHTVFLFGPTGATVVGKF